MVEQTFLEQSFATSADTIAQPSCRISMRDGTARSHCVRKHTVWRDSALGLAASVGVGILAGSALAAVVFSLVTITIGH